MAQSEGASEMTTTQRAMNAWHTKTAFQEKYIKRELAKNRVRDFTVELSFPDSNLMQNRSNGKHWAFSHQAKVAQHDEAYLLTRQSIVQSGFEVNTSAMYRVVMTFNPPDQRRRDVSNLHAACKAMLDGIAEAMGIDDSRFTQHEQHMGSVHLRGRVIVEVSEIR